MASGRGYDGAITPVVEPFTKEQRQRLEAITFARKLVGANHNPNDQPVGSWLRVAEYIVSGQ